MEGATLIVVPVLGRPHRVAPLLRSAAAATVPPHRVLFVCSPHDLEEQDAVDVAGGEWVAVDRDPGPGDYAYKINWAYRHSDEPFLFLGADDLDFHPGWLEACHRKLGGPFHVVGTNDLGNSRVIAGVHSTHTFVTRTYIDEHGTIDEPGKVLHEGYPHEYVDDEFIETAKARHVWVFARAAKVEHLHPLWGKNDWDALYAGNAKRMKAGRRLYLRRRPLWT